MRLTYGPLPAAVYWRRRALVLGAVVLVVLVIVYACGGPSAGGPPPQNLGSTTTEPTAAATGSPSPSTAPPFTLPVNTQTPITGPCTDAEILLTAAATPANLPVGGAATFTLRIKNVSMRTCIRNIGSVPQELRLLDGSGALVWSSDDCPSPDHTPYDADRPFTPGMELPFPIDWSGYRTRTSSGALTCVKPTVSAGNYQLVARLGTLFSEPVDVIIGGVS